MADISEPIFYISVAVVLLGIASCHVIEHRQDLEVEKLAIEKGWCRDNTSDPWKPCAPPTAAIK